MGRSEHEDRAHRALEGFLGRVRQPVRGSTDDLDHAAARLFEAFSSTEIGAILLKGPALREMLYRPGEQRPYSDVDVLVAPADFDRAQATLSEFGYRDASTALGIDDVGGVVHDQSWVGMDERAGRELLVELHLWLAGARADPRRAWEVLTRHTTAMDLCGHSVPVLDREGQAMHLALHAAQHGAGYGRGLRELSLGLDRWPRADWERAVKLAVEIDAGAPVAAGLRLVPEGRRLASEMRLPLDSRLDWEVQNRGTRPRGTFHLEAFTEAHGARERARALRRAILPGRQWIIWQHPWARPGGWRLAAAYAAHVLRAPLWAARAISFRRRARGRELRDDAQ